MNRCLPMDNHNFIIRSIKTSLVVGAVFFIFLSQRSSLQVLWGGALGVMLSLLNLILLSRIWETLHKKISIFYVILKFPLFYGLLIFFLYQIHLSVYAFMIGFSVPLFVILLKTFGSVIYVERATITRSA